MAMSQTGKLRSFDWADGVPRARREKKGARPTARIAAMACLVVILCAGFVAQRVYVMNLTYLLEAERARAREVARENEFLQLEVARARSLDRIEAIARGRLGMVPFERRDVVVIPGDGRRGETVLAQQQAEPRRRPADGWLAAFLEWAEGRWPGRTAEAGEP